MVLGHPRGQQKKVIEFIAAKKTSTWSSIGADPLHYAVDFGQDEIAQMLISAGADQRAHLVGDTPLDYANYKQNELIAGSSAD